MSENFEGINLDEARALLDEGRLVPPQDAVTANGLELWQDSPPMYHDLSCMPYTKYDVQEWTGKLRKFKAEVVRHADQCRKLEKEVATLQTQLEADTLEFETIEAGNEGQAARTAELEEALAAETARRNLNQAEVLHFRRAKTELLKQQKAVEKEISETRARIGLLRTEVERNRLRHEAALGEKEKLNLERRWFFHERLLLEETTTKEIQDIAVMKEKLEKLRHCMHKAWRDSKELDLLGHLRAVRRNQRDEQWYAARRRLFGARRAVEGNEEVAA